MNVLKSARSVPAARLGYTSVMAAVLALTAGAYANAQVTSADIVDGQVKTPDIASAAVTSAKIAGSAVTGAKIASNAVTGAKIASNAVTGVKVQDDSLTGADIDETTLSGVDAHTLDGKLRSELFSIQSFFNSTVLTMPACSNGLAYMQLTYITDTSGNLLLSAAFTAGTGSNFSAPFGIAARLERTAPSPIIGEWQENHFGSGGAGRSNIATTQIFPVAVGTNVYVLRVCDASDTAGGQTIRGQMSYVFKSS